MLELIWILLKFFESADIYRQWISVRIWILVCISSSSISAIGQSSQGHKTHFAHVLPTATSQEKQAGKISTRWHKDHRGERIVSAISLALIKVQRRLAGTTWNLKKKINQFSWLSGGAEGGSRISSPSIWLCLPHTPWELWGSLALTWFWLHICTLYKCLTFYPPEYSTQQRCTGYFHQEYFRINYKSGNAIWGKKKTIIVTI